MRYRPLLLLLTGLLLLSGACRAEPLLLAEGQQFHSLKGHLHWYRDSSATLDVSDIIEKDRAGQFTATADFPSFGYTTDVIWIRFTLQGSVPQHNHWLLSVAPAFIDHVQLFHLKNGQIQDLGKQGDRESWSHRTVPWRHSLYELELPSEQATTFYLRLQSTSSIAVSAQLWESSVVVSKAGEKMLLFGLLMATGVLMTSLSLLFFILLRDRVYFYFMLYTLSLTYAVMQLEGVIHFIVKPDTPLHLEWLQVINQGIALIGMVLLLCEILKLREYRPQLQRWIAIGVISLAVIGCIPVLFGRYDISIATLWLPIGLMNITIPVAAFIFRKRIGAIAWLYCAAFSVIGINTIVRLGWVFGLSTPTRMSENIFPVVMLFHAVVLFITMATRYVQVDRSMRRATQQALKEVEKSERELQGVVSRRTAELDTANRNLASQLDISQQYSTMLEATRDRLSMALEAERHASLEQRRFLRMVAHEFRTPLSVIDLAAEMISADPRTPDVHATTNCDRILQASQRMAALINQALREDKLDSAAWRKNSAFIQVADLLESAVHYGEMASGQRHKFQIKCDDDLLIQGDHDLILTMINNIIDNAVKYSPPGTTIEVSGQRNSDGAVSISIADQGPGMTSEELRQVLEKYVRADSSRNIPGMGLGLYLVDRIVRLHDATMDIKSAPGAGTRFTIVFPSTGNIRETEK